MAERTISVKERKNKKRQLDNEVEQLAKKFGFEIDDLKENAEKKRKEAKKQKNAVNTLSNEKAEELKIQTGDWVANMHNSILQIINLLDESEAGVLMILILHMNLHSDGRLEKDGKALIQKDIIEILGEHGIAVRRAKALLTSLGKKEYNGQKILISKRSKVSLDSNDTKTANTYWINKEFHMMGEHGAAVLSSNFSKVFKEKAKNLLKGISLQVAGALYKMMPFFHQQDYYLSKDPDSDLRKNTNISFDDNVENGTCYKNNHMDIIDLYNMFDKKDERTVKERLEALETAKIIKFSKTGDVYRIQVHPLLFTRTKEFSRYAKHVIYEFEQHD